MSKLVSSIPCRLLLCLLVCLILFYSCVVPVRASAVLLEVLAASARSMIASVIRSCGVYVADGLATEFTTAMNNFESLTDSVLSYVWERLPDNLKVVNFAGTLMLKMVLRNGIYYAPRTLVELVCEGLRQEIPDIELIDFAAQLGYSPKAEHYDLFNTALNQTLMDGSTECYNAQLIEKYQYCCFFELVPYVNAEDERFICYETPLLVFSNVPFGDGFRVAQDGDFLQLKVKANTEFSYLLTSTPFTSTMYNVTGPELYENSVIRNFRCTSFTFYTMERQNSSTGVEAESSGLSFDDDVASISSTWDSKSVTVTDKKLDTSAVTVIPVSVHPVSSAATISRSEAQAGTVVDAETATVEDEVVGDVTTETGFWSSVLDWLSRILSAIKSLVAGITTPIVNSLSQVISAIKAVPIAITDFFTLKFENLDFYTLDLTSFFPFCIPFDLYDMLAAFVAEPEAPVFTFATGFLGNYYEIDIDLSPWDSVAKTLRTIQLCICIVGLAFATRKFIKW